MATKNLTRFEQSALDLTDPRQVAQWFVAELHHLGMIENAEAAEDDEGWDDMDADLREALTHCFANMLKAMGR